MPQGAMNITATAETHGRLDYFPMIMMMLWCTLMLLSYQVCNAKVNACNAI